MAHHDGCPDREIVELSSEGLCLGTGPQLLEGPRPRACPEAEQIGDEDAGSGEHQALGHTAPVGGPTREAVEQDEGGAGVLGTMCAEVHSTNLSRQLEIVK
jgi:hypothetical protein